MKEKVQEILESAGMRMAPFEEGCYAVGEKNHEAEVWEYFVLFDIKNRIFYSTYGGTRTYEEIARYDSDDEFIESIPNVLDRVEIIMFARKDGQCEFFKYTGKLENYLKETEVRKENLKQNGYDVLGVEFYSVMHLEPILYDESFNYKDILCCVDRIYDQLIEIYKDRKPYQQIWHRNLEEKYKLPIIDSLIRYNKTLGMDREGRNAPDIIIVSVDGASLGRIYSRMTILPYPSDEVCYTVSPKSMETIREKLDYQFENY